MTWLRGHEYPVPEIHHAAGRDLVMERVDGVTMLEAIDQRPWTLVSHVRTLVDLQQRLGALEAPDWLRVDQRVPVGRSVVHGDLHPMNVILGPRGPVVIDWTNAMAGPQGFDAALSYVLMATYEADGPKESIGQWAFVRLFERSHGRRLVRQHLSDAAAFRLADSNLTEGERAAIIRMLGADGVR